MGLSGRINEDLPLQEKKIRRPDLVVAGTLSSLPASDMLCGMIAVTDSFGGTRAMSRCDMLGGAPFSDMPDALFRPYLGPAHRATLGQIAQWMGEAGMEVEIDAAGNIIGHYHGLMPRRTGSASGLTCR